MRWRCNRHRNLLVREAGRTWKGKGAAESQITRGSCTKFSATDRVFLVCFFVVFFSEVLPPSSGWQLQSQESWQIRGLDSAGVMSASANINIGKEKKIIKKRRSTLLQNYFSLPLKRKKRNILKELDSRVGSSGSFHVKESMTYEES